MQRGELYCQLCEVKDCHCIGYVWSIPEIYEKLNKGFDKVKKNGYLKKLPIDPWGEPYLYFSEGRQIEVYSLGSDRREGGEGVDADLKLSDL